MHSRKPAYIVFVRLPLLVMSFLLLGMGIFSKRGYMDWRRIATQNDILKSKMQLLEVQKRELDMQVHALLHDQEEQERVVRQVLGYIKPFETVIEFE